MSSPPTSCQESCRRRIPLAGPVHADVISSAHSTMLLFLSACRMVGKNSHFKSMGGATYNIQCLRDVLMSVCSLVVRPPEYRSASHSTPSIQLDRTRQSSPSSPPHSQAGLLRSHSTHRSRPAYVLLQA